MMHRSEDRLNVGKCRISAATNYLSEFHFISFLHRYTLYTRWRDALDLIGQGFPSGGQGVRVRRHKCWLGGGATIEKEKRSVKRVWRLGLCVRLSVLIIRMPLSLLAWYVIISGSPSARSIAMSTSFRILP